MLVREVIASALILLGRAELASALASGAGAEEEKDLTDTLLYCFNAVENEIARNYIPLVYREELLSKNNKFLCSRFIGKILFCVSHDEMFLCTRDGNK